MDLPSNNLSRLRVSRHMNGWSSVPTTPHQQSPETRVIKETVGSQSSQVELSGLREVLNKNLSIWARLFWLIIFVTAIIISVIQSSKIIENLHDDPSITTVRYKRNESVAFPSVVVCPSDRDEHGAIVKNPVLKPAVLTDNFGKVTEDDVLNRLQLGTLTLSELWNLYRLTITDISVATSDHSEDVASKNNGTMKFVIISEVYTILGTCVQLRLKDNLKLYQSGTFFKLKLYGDSLLAMMALHQSDDLPIENYLYHRSGIAIERDLPTRQYLRVTQIRNRNTWNRPCGTSAVVSNCLAHCFINTFTAKETTLLCRLPFMSSFDDVVACSSRADMQNMMSAIHNATEVYDPGLCGCPRKCLEIMYVMEARHSLSYSPTFAIEIYMSDVWITTMDEVAAYNEYKALSDLGGVVGLWLGMCLLGAIEFLASCFEQLRLKIKERKASPLCTNGIRFRVVIARNLNLNKKRSPIADYPGFNRITKEESSLWVRTLWLAVFVTALSMCIHQCGQQIVYYFSDPSTTNIFYTLNETIAFPSVTICLKSNDGLLPAINPNLIEQMFGRPQSKLNVKQLIRNRNLTIEEIWNASSLHISKVSIEATQGDWFLHIIPTIIGNCHSFIPKNISKYIGMDTSPKLKLVSRSGIKLIIVHQTEDTPLVQYLAQSYTTNSRTADFDWKSRITFRVTQLSYRNTRTFPCQDRNHVVQCLVKCIEKAVAAKITHDYCRLPYMTAVRPEPLCESEKEMYVMLNVTLSVIETFRQEDCLCTEVCRQTVYSTEFLNEELLRIRGGSLIVELRVRDNRIMVVEESSAYTGFALFADIGGTFGLFTGLCILNMFEIIEAVYSMILNCTKRCVCYNWKEKDDISNIPPVRTVIIQDLRETASKATGDYDVALPGISHSVHKNSPLWVRFVWVVISVVACVLCGYQLADRIQHYASDPTEVRTYYSSNKSITFPLLLICPFLQNSIYWNRNYNKHFSDYWNISQFLDIHGGISINEEDNIPLIISQSTHRVDYDNIRNSFAVITRENTSAGICLMLQINGPVVYKGYRTSIDFILSLSSRYVWMAYFSNDDRRIVNYISKKDTIVEHYEKEAKISLQITEVFHRNTYQNPCIHGENSALCVTNCLENNIYAKINIKCRLPFMKESRAYPICQTRNEYLEIKKAAAKVLNTFDRKECNCPRNCKEIIYSLEEAGIDTGRSNFVLMNIRVPENRISVIQEEAAYGFITLLSELGGSLGLFFGIGLLQILELVTASISRLCK